MGAIARPITALLVANRGEIVLRIARTAKRMGIRVIAVYSDADAEAMHVAAADMAIRIGPAPARDSYLNIPAVIAAAHMAGADAIHPGYGFLAENAEFAAACELAGLAFVGPPASAIAMMGDKARARALAVAAGVPVVPGYDGSDQTPQRLALAAEAIGYPVMLKAAAGGGGRGMRIAATPGEFAAAFEGAGREAEAAFGDRRMIVEKYLAAPRHIEVQIFADSAGRVIHLFERDCSIQRRHQKVIEEAPAIGLTAEMRGKLRQSSIALAKACAYAGAGTMEFLVSGNHFYFMEMNTRLQVEHTVTEAVTGLDLVEWQLRIAGGEDLPAAQDAIVVTGHAVEARLCAEDPDRGFLPQTGRLAHLRLPAGLPGVRVDSGVRQGDDIPVHYDSLIAKIISRGTNRTEAIAQLSAALAATEIAGLPNNRRLLAAIAGHSAFRAAKIDTGFIARNAHDLLGNKPQPDERVLALASLAALRRAERQAAHIDPADPHSPWALANGWRLGSFTAQTLQLQTNGVVHKIGIQYREAGYDMLIAGRSIAVSGSLAGDGALTARIGEAQLQARAIFDSGGMTLFINGEDYSIIIVDPYRPAAGRAADEGHLLSPMPGVVVAVAAEAGQKVSKGSILVVVEAMKMEHTITAPRDGLVKALNVAAGDRVAAGEELVVLEAVA